jgi:transcriptional regulator with XRE-family HTH domain
MVTTPPRELTRIWTMAFADQLTAARKERKLTQQALADLVGVHVTQLRRYEAGTAQPTLDVLRNIATALAVTIDSLAFDQGERGPTDDLALVFEAASQLDDEGKNLVRALVEGVVLRNQARRFSAAS